MPRTNVAVSPYPDVPLGAGVPPVRRDPMAAVFKTLLLIADIATVFRLFEGPQWGIFDQSGSPVAIPDSVVSVDFRREWRISDYPVEQGGFQSYDKVAVPYDARVQFACDGTTTPRSLFLAQIDAAANALNLFVVVTPDATYPSVNIIHYDYRRERQNGVGIILVDIWLQEVRTTVTTQFTNTNTQQPTGVADTNAGAVQPVQPTSSQIAASGPTYTTVDSSGQPVNLTQAQQATIFNAPTGSTVTFPAPQSGSTFTTVDSSGNAVNLTQAQQSQIFNAPTGTTLTFPLQ